MEPVSKTPTKPVDYAVLSGVYGGLLGALALAARKRRCADEPVSGTDVAVTGAATFALAKLLAHEKVETWLRAPFVDETPSGEKRPKGRRMRYAIGELFTCSRCAGAWSALGVVGLRVLSPDTGRVVTNVLAASAANDYLQSGFRLLCNEGNLAQLRAEQDERELRRAA
jgi:Protein of unknown function (DUF1360)